MSPAHFAKLATNGLYRADPPHIASLNRTLIDLSYGRLEGAIISMPPRHGKSMLCSHYFPAWFLGNFPNRRVILASAESDFASQWGRKARDVLEEFGPSLFGVEVNQSSRSASRWDIEGNTGGMNTAGMGGSITGKGAHAFICDDPIKNHEQALSEVFRTKCWDWFMSVAETRAEPGCFFLIVLTRWHEDDIAGRLIHEINEGTRPNWKIVSMPAIAEEGEVDAIGRKPGEALWPWKYPIEWFNVRKNRLDCDEARLGPYWWESIYQQRPVPRGGGTFKSDWFRYFDIYMLDNEEVFKLRRPHDEKVDVTAKEETKRAWRKNECFCFFTVDLAISLKQTADFFVLGIWYVTPDMDLILYDVYRDRLEGPDQVALIRRLCQQHERLSFIGIESVGYQAAIVQELVRYGVPAKECTVDTDKLTRAQLAAVRFQAGKVYFRSGAAWLSAVEHELLQFPSGKHDDIVDVISMGAKEVVEFVIPSVVR